MKHGLCYNRHLETATDLRTRNATLFSILSLSLEGEGRVRVRRVRHYLHETQ